MFDIVARAEKMGNADFFGTVFGTTSMNAVRAYMTQGGRMYDSLVNLGDTAGLLEQKSATMANTLKSNFQNLQTAFLSFADKNLTDPLQKLTDFLNELAKDPEKVERGIKGIALAIGGLAAVKIGAGIVSFVAGLNSLKSGGALNVDGLANAGGGAGIPVHVTNWGGTAGASMMPGVGNSGPVPGRSGSPTPPALLNNKSPLDSARTAVGNITGQQYALGAAGAGIGAAFLEIPQMVGELQAIDQNEALTNKERGEAKGGAIGDATGSIVGAAAGGAAGIAAGAAVGAAVGSVVPVLGTAVGALVGAGVGALGMWLGGKAGRAVGTAIGGAVAGDDVSAAQSLANIYNNSVMMYPGIAPVSADLAYYNAAMHYQGIANTTTVTNPVSVNDLIITPQGQYSTHPDDYIFALKDPAALIEAGLPAIKDRYQRVQSAPGIVQYNTNASGAPMVNDSSLTPQDKFASRSKDYSIAMKSPAALANAGLPTVNNRYQTFQEVPGIVQYNTSISNAQTMNDFILAPQGQYNALPDNYIPSMKDHVALANAGLPSVNNLRQTFQGTPGVIQHNTNTTDTQTVNDFILAPQDQYSPAALVNSEILKEVRSVERVPPAIPPVIVEGEIELRSELTIDDKGYRLRQSVGKNTTPYKFAVGSVKDARVIQ
jgi:hypothetical protein